MGRTEALETRIEEIQNEITLLEQPYQRALLRNKGEDAEWEERSEAMKGRIFRLVKQFKIGDNGEKAIAIVAQCSILAHELTASEDLIVMMKEKKRLLAQAQRDLSEASGGNA